MTTVVVLVTLLVVTACGCGSVLVMNAIAGSVKAAGAPTIAAWLQAVGNVSVILSGVPIILFFLLFFFFAIYDAFASPPCMWPRETCTAFAACALAAERGGMAKKKPEQYSTGAAKAEKERASSSSSSSSAQPPVSG